MLVDCPKNAVGDVLLLGVLGHPFAGVIGHDRLDRRLEDVRDDLVNLLPGVGNVHHVVEAQQHRGPGLFLQEIIRPRAAPGQVMLHLVAWRADAVAADRVRPLLRDVRPDVVETVQEVSRSIVALPDALLDVQNPLVGRADVFKNQRVEDGGFVNEELRECATRNLAVGLRTGRGIGHNSKIRLRFGLGSVCAKCARRLCVIFEGAKSRRKVRLGCVYSRPMKEHRAAMFGIRVPLGRADVWTNTP